MPISEQGRLFCFGYGYCASALASALHEDKAGWSLAGTVRDPAAREDPDTPPISLYAFGNDRPLSDPRRMLAGTTHLLISAPPDDTGDPAFVAHAADIARTDTVRWIGYLSATSVYGDRDGEWVDETTPLRPTSQRGSRRALAEAQWLSLHKDHGLPVHVFRLAGIYGPGRSAIDSVRAGNAQRIDKPGHAFSRIHVEDIIQVLRASMARPRPGAIYNLCDDEAAPSHEVIAEACRLTDANLPPLIPFAQAELSPMARSFYSDNKRLRNDLIKTELGVTLKYPNYRSGLRGCLAAEEEK